MAAYQYKPVLMTNPVYDVISNRILESFPTACILYIDEIQNDYLLGRFEIAKKEMQEQMDADRIRPLYKEVKVLQLFHGTTRECVNSISQEGFRRDLNKSSAYGVGTYFSPAAGFSWGYSLKETASICDMFLCDVLLGTLQNDTQTLFTDGRPTVTKLPPKPKRTQPTKAPRFARISTSGPNIYCCPHDNHIYPRYVIAFHKTPPL